MVGGRGGGWSSALSLSETSLADRTASNNSLSDFLRRSSLYLIKRTRVGMLGLRRTSSSGMPLWRNWSSSNKSSASECGRTVGTGGAPGCPVGID